MTLDEIDAAGLMREAYRIEGITGPECRSIFLDWALKLPDGTDVAAAIETVLAAYGAADHPMTTVLRDGLTPAAPPRRRGRRPR